jgi:protein-tyrosine-phosphatase
MIAALVVAASIIDGYARLIAPHQKSRTMTERRDMPQPALHIAAAILQRDFSETFGVETIERFLNSCYDQLAARATVMCCGDACPIYPGKRYEEWTLPDPAGQSLDAVRPIRDSIEDHIRRLLGDLRLPADA